MTTDRIVENQKKPNAFSVSDFIGSKIMWKTFGLPAFLNICVYIPILSFVFGVAVKVYKILFTYGWSLINF